MDQIDPEIALCQVFEYTAKHAMTALTISSTLEQRMRNCGNLIVTPLSTDINSLTLENVWLPNWVVSHSRRIVTYPVVLYRINID